MEPFEAHIFDGVANALRDLVRSVAADTYVVSLSVHNEDGDPRRPYLVVGINTEQHVERTEARASSTDEARWNPAYWMDDPQWFVAESDIDPAGARLRLRWVQELGLWFTDEEEEGPDWEAIDRRAGQIDVEFRELVGRAVERLHAEGVVVSAFGRPLPVIVHEDESAEETALYNERVNPSGLADEFVTWVRGRP